MDLLLVLYGIGGLAVLVVIFVLIKAKKKKVSGRDRLKLNNELSRLASLKKEEQIMGFDKLLDFALGCIGKQGSLGEKLKQTGPLFSDLNGVWRAHKLRNNLSS